MVRKPTYLKWWLDFQVIYICVDLLPVKMMSTLVKFSISVALFDVSDVFQPDYIFPSPKYGKAKTLVQTLVLLLVIFSSNSCAMDMPFSLCVTVSIHDLRAVYSKVVAKNKKYCPNDGVSW